MTKFSDLKLDPAVLKAIGESGYETPTPIQAGAIPPALEGRDVLGIAQTGTGKTASFVLPMITLLGRGRARARMPRSLVLCPTRELAAQVAENFDTYAKHTRLTKALLIGGVSFGEQDKLIDRGVDVLIATPGRLLDHFERGKLLLTGVQIMVVDEADRMLDMGFIPDIERIFQLTPFTRQTLFFSATMAPEIERITDTFLHAPERIEVARQATASETITQKLVELVPTRRDMAAKQKRDLLRALIDAEGEGLKNAIIFCNRKTDVDIVAKSLAKHGYDAAPIHGDLDQSHRTRTLDSFRDGTLKLLIASDVAARGLDIPAVSHVFNYDLPSHAEDYVHRIGRTGRAGRLGSAFSIATPSDEKYLAAIENLVKKTLPRTALPEGFTLSETDRSAGRDDRRNGRDKKRGQRRDDERREDRASEPRREDRAPEPRREEARREDVRREEVRREDVRREPAKEEYREEKREDRRDPSRDRRGRRDEVRGPAVMGMGDHVPEFMLVELRPALAAIARDSGETPEQPVESVPAGETLADKPRRGRNRRKKSEAMPDTSSETAVTDAPIVLPDESIALETAASDPAGNAAPEAMPESSVEAPAQETVEKAPKPKRTRRKKAETEAEAVPDASAPAEKPKRTRRKKPDEAAEPTPEDAPKPKRTRRKKTDEAPAEPQVSADADA
ncbi:DEAD/DEAH box helicase [Paracoccus subflavus]|uniref:DEAD-box ATP-dependent RNA helicase RhpA n=1 Tax=Paracoccus subflavus TaxID=2528244 RepID=A0A4Q9G744_9RHOB|nr:DEAD/DEAH box helicase [Paracoccus subflavus]